MDSTIKAKIEETYSEYVNEITAQGAWSAHAYAPEYLSKIYDFFKEVLEPLKDTKEYGWMIAVNMFTDYENLITKVYQSDNMTSDEKEEIAWIINEQYSSIIDSMAKIVCKYYEKETGHELVIKQED